MFLQTFIPYLIALTVGVLLVPIYDAVQSSVAALKRLPPPVTQFALGLINFGLNYAAQMRFAALQCAPNCDITTLPISDTELLLTAAASYGAQLIFKGHIEQRKLTAKLTKPAHDPGA